MQKKIYWFRKDGDFYEKFRAAQEAILSGTYPQLIPEGSSGTLQSLLVYLTTSTVNLKAEGSRFSV